jgi:hypothetical protein
VELLESDPVSRQTTVHSKSVPLWLSAAIVVGMLGIALHSSFFSPLNNFFDDSLMFYRYAINMRHGLGISWNLDAVPTYGCTSLTWLAIIWFLSFLPIEPIRLLMLASLFTWFAALAVLVYWIHRNAASSFFRSPGNTLLVLALALELNLATQRNVMNGMDTMLAFLCHVLVAIAALRFVRHQTATNALLCATVGLFAYETRPEGIICAVLVPALLWLLTPGERSLRAFGIFLGAQVGLVVAALLVVRWYFGSFVPLAFYLKSRHGYVGYTGYDGPGEPIIYFFSYIALPLAAIFVLMRRSDRPMLVAFFLPTAISAAYLFTVMQIMGYWGRYYFPYTAYVIVPALLLVDRALAEDRKISVRTSGLRFALAFLPFVAATWATGADLAGKVNNYYKAHYIHPVDPPRAVMEASQPLPYSYKDMLVNFTREIAARLPAGSTIAASEVGYLGAFAPQISVIDLAGLNDREIALNGFSMTRLLARRPDVIWFPEVHYTGMIADILRNPHFLEQYDYYDHAYGFGLAIRKDGPSHDLALHLVESHWPERYPGYAPMAAYKVTAIESLTGSKSL